MTGVGHNKGSKNQNTNLLEELILEFESWMTILVPEDGRVRRLSKSKSCSRFTQ